MRTSLSLPLLAALSILLTACASKTIPPEDYSGFLSDYSQLTQKQLPSGQAVLSWVNPFSPLAAPVQQLTRPLLDPLRRVIPVISGVDLSLLVAILLLQMLLIYV